IEDYKKQDQRENVKQQMNKYSDIIEKEFSKSDMKIEEDLQQIPTSISKLSADETFPSSEIDKLYIDDQSMKTSAEIQQIIEQSSSEKRLLQIRTSSQTSEEDKTRIIGYSKVSGLIKLSTIQDDTINKKGKQLAEHELHIS
ncbi:unnamed protein product, partial [Rotaria sp. Silwood1]